MVATVFLVMVIVVECNWRRQRDSRHLLMPSDPLLPPPASEMSGYGRPMRTWPESNWIWEWKIVWFNEFLSQRKFLSHSVLWMWPRCARDNIVQEVRFFRVRTFLRPWLHHDHHDHDNTIIITMPRAALAEKTLITPMTNLLRCRPHLRPICFIHVNRPAEVTTV